MDKAAVEKPKRAKRGRPSGNPKWAAEWRALLCERVASGRSLRDICSDDDMPAISTVELELDRNAEFSEQYARAYERSADAIVEECYNIADDGSNDWMKKNDGENPGYVLHGEHIQRSKLRVDFRKWDAARRNPRKFGDKLAVDATITGPEMSEADKVDRFLAQVPLLNKVLAARGLMVKVVEVDA